jgi:DNA-binding transcriptional ArsR family regulator
MVTRITFVDNPVFDALGDPTRRAILDLMREGPRPAGKIAAHFPVSRPAIAKHVSILKKAGLLVERTEGRNRIYALEPQALAGVDRWLQPYRAFWAARLVDLKHIIEEGHQNGGH